jgi:hypothetical protein
VALIHVALVHVAIVHVAIIHVAIVHVAIVYVAIIHVAIVHVAIVYVATGAQSALEVRGDVIPNFPRSHGTRVCFRINRVCFHTDRVCLHINHPGIEFARFCLLLVGRYPRRESRRPVGVTFGITFSVTFSSAIWPWTYTAGVKGRDEYLEEGASLSLQNPKPHTLNPKP